MFDYYDCVAYQPIEGVPVIVVDRAYCALDLTGTVWTRTEVTENNVTTVTVTCTFPQGAVYTQVGTLSVSGGTRTYTMISSVFEEAE